MNASTKTTMFTGLLSLCLFSPATAVDFSGSLKEVSITDAQATNKAPVAMFTYTQNGDIVTFDASGSSDPDGSISKYKWDFGNGTIAEGVTTNYNSSDAATLKVTLTVVDNNNGVAINQQTITPATKKITDDFSTDTSGNYTSISNNLSISNGVATCAAWSSASFYHKTSTETNDNYAQVDVTLSNSDDYAGVVVRWNSTTKTGYSVRLSGSSVKLYAHNGTNTVLLNGYNAIFSTNMTYTLKVTVNGSLITGYINGVERIASTNTLYSVGEHVGITMSRGYGGTTTVDNFIGGSL